MCTNPDITPSVRLAAVKLMLEYSTGGPPQFATAEDATRFSVPDTEEYRAFREYQLEQFKSWKDGIKERSDSSIQLSPPLEVYVDVGQHDTRADSGGK